MGITNTAKNMIALGAGGSYSVSRDVLKHQIWDTRYFNTAPSNNTFFAQPIGAQWRVGSKTKNETNLQDSGKLPNGQTFLVTRMGLALISAYDVGNSTTVIATPNASLIAQAYTNILQSSVFEIRVAGREYDFQIHGRQFLPSLSINGYNSATAGSVARMGDVTINGWVKLEPTPIFLDELVSFNVAQIVDNADTENILLADKPLNNSFLWLSKYFCTMQVTLEGVLTRAK